VIQPPANGSCGGANRPAVDGCQPWLTPGCALTLITPDYRLTGLSINEK